MGDGDGVEEAGVVAAVERVQVGKGVCRKREVRDKRETKIMDRGESWSKEGMGQR